MTSKHPMILHLCLIALFASATVFAQPTGYWQGKEREVRYTPDGEEFVIKNGNKRFTRAIYGTNTGFRFETSDFPEFGLYMPNLGGSVYMAIATPQKTLWINEMEYIESRFKSGQRTYIVKDRNILKNGTLTVDAVALSDGDGFTVRYDAQDIPEGTQILWIYGGANHQRFSREGDLGADPFDSFFIKPANCEGNIFSISGNAFQIYYGQRTRSVSDDEAYENPEGRQQRATPTPPADSRTIAGIFPEGTQLREADGNRINELQSLIASQKTSRPVLLAEYAITQPTFYFEMHQPASRKTFTYGELAEAHRQGVAYRQKISSTLKIKTPDPYINTLGGIFSGAEDAVWENSYLHGAIGWRMPLLGWRAGYLGDLMGKHDRAKIHFDGYLASQLTEVPITLPHAQDTALNLARSAKIWGTPMYSNGYIGRNPNRPNRTNSMHHYDMNLVFFDILLWHLNWTGDLDYARKIFPYIKRHLAWEKQLFDPDNDGLYDSYACIWASDAVQYNGGKGTHSSAYNYRANKLTAELARKLGEDPAPFEREATLILEGVNRELWIPEKGWWAEFKDNMGRQMRHDQAALWSIYHSIDSDIHDSFKAYQATRYIDTELPHIPVLAKNLPDDTNYLVATTNWQPYIWSINNVAFAEVTHTALAYWQTGRYDEAFKLFKGSVLDAMYLGSGPGNITQVSFYDAARGELYRDFSDPVATGVRAVVHGLYGIIPDLLNNQLIIRPGFPDEWDFAEIESPNMAYTFKRTGNTDRYMVTPNLLKKDIRLFLEVNAERNKVKSIKVNGRKVSHSLMPEAVSVPKLRIDAGIAAKYDVVIEWEGEKCDKAMILTAIANGDRLSVKISGTPVKIYDPQKVLSDAKIDRGALTGNVSAVEGYRTVFVQVSSGDMTCWKPVSIKVLKPVEVTSRSDQPYLDFIVWNNIDQALTGDVYVNGKKTEIDLKTKGTASTHIETPVATFGTNTVEIRTDKETHSFRITNWNIPNTPDANYQTVDMTTSFNDQVTNIFEYGKYISPRWPYTTLQVPTQGMGQWCHPADLSVIDDSGFRDIALKNNHTFTMPQGIPFATPGNASSNNIAFTTLWDNYPDSLSIPLQGKASKAYFLVAASTYHMQAHIPNGYIKVKYKDGTHDALELVLPENLLPLDQDIFIDGWAFRSKERRPWRVRLKTGDVHTYHAEVLGKRMSNNPIYIDGGMATMLDLPLNPQKELESLTLETVANEVIIGLMGVTLVR